MFDTRKQNLTFMFATIKHFAANLRKGLIKYSREKFSKHWVSTVRGQTLWQKIWTRIIKKIGVI